MQGKIAPRQTDRHSQGARPGRGLGLWIRRGLVWVVVGLLTLAASGAIYQTISTRLDEQAYPPSGEMVTSERIE